MTMIYLFPGQGAQKKGMGENLFSRFPHLVKQANDILGYSVAELCLQDPNDQLNITLYTQPALYIVNALSYFAASDDGAIPLAEYAAGHSLGEYNALLAAEAFDFCTGLELVKKRAQLMHNAKPGAMSAIIGLSAEQIQQVFATLNINTVDMANFNSPTQIVISGIAEDLDRIDPACKEAGAKLVVRLNVSGAFHSRYMKPAALEFKEFLSSYMFNPLKLTVIANSTAKPYLNDEVAKRLSEQIFSPVLWTKSVEYLLKTPEPKMKEFGPQGILTKLVKQIADTAVAPVML